MLHQWKIFENVFNNLGEHSVENPIPTFSGAVFKSWDALQEWSENRKDSVARGSNLFI